MRGMLRDRSRHESAEAIGAALAEYQQFLGRVTLSQAPLEPSPIVDLVWHTHQQFPKRYGAECRRLAGAFVDHDDDL